MEYPADGSFNTNLQTGGQTAPGPIITDAGITKAPETGDTGGWPGSGAMTSAVSGLSKRFSASPYGIPTGDQSTPVSAPDATVHKETATPRGNPSDPANTPGRGLMNAGNAYGDTRGAVSGTTAPKSYQAPGVVSNAAAGLPAGSGEPTGMTTEQSNAYYGPIRAGMDAKTAQDQQQSRVAGIAQGDASAAGWRADQAENDAMRARNGPGYASPREARALQERALVSRGSSDKANAAFGAAVGGRNYIQEAGERQKLTQVAQGSQQELAKGAQGLKAGAQGLQSGAGALTLQGQQIRQGEIQSHIQEHMGELQKRALGTGPDAEAAQASLAMYQKAQTGKGGPITDEDILKAHADMATKAIQMGGPEALKSLPSFHEYKQTLLGNGGTPPGIKHTDAKGNVAYKQADGSYLDATGKPIK